MPDFIYMGSAEQVRVSFAIRILQCLQLPKSTAENEGKQKYRGITTSKLTISDEVNHFFARK